jgi:predicted metal-dependent hydrolase
LGDGRGTVTVAFVRKRIKNVYLKVERDASVVLNLPYGTPDAWATDYLLSMRDWVCKHVKTRQEAFNKNNLSEVESYKSALIFGKSFEIVRLKGAKPHAVFSGGTVNLYLTNPSDETEAGSVYRAWLRKLAAKIYAEELNDFYDRFFAPLGIAKPIFQIRKMKTLWGSCTPKQSKIVFNENLIRSDMACIRYVVLHELTHLIHYRHDADFYAFVEARMPDWKECKKRLRQYM